MNSLFHFAFNNLKFKIICCAPLAAYTFLYLVIVKRIPDEVRPNIDVHTLPAITSTLQFGVNLQHFPRNIIPNTEDYGGLLVILDLIAAAVYSCHFITWGFAIMLFVYHHIIARNSKEENVEESEDQKDDGNLKHWQFMWCIGWIDLITWITQMFWPTAPPWYNDIYGFRPANYAVKPFEAGLQRLDRYLGEPLFASFYSNNPVVFGAFPSLHVAHPVSLALFWPFERLSWLIWLYPIITSWAAVYLNHHYLVDVLGGWFYALIVIKTAGKHFPVKFCNTPFVKQASINRTKEV